METPQLTVKLIQVTIKCTTIRKIEPIILGNLFIANRGRGSIMANHDTLTANCELQEIKIADFKFRTWNPLTKPDFI